MRRRRPGWHTGCQGWPRCGAPPAAAAGLAAGAGGRAAGAAGRAAGAAGRARSGAGGGRNQRWTVVIACQCAGAVLLLSGARAVCTAATRFTDVAALAIAELSTTEACDAISMGGWRKKRGACDTGAGRLFGAPGMLGNRPAVQTRAQVLANAIALRAAWVLAAVNRAQHMCSLARRLPLHDVSVLGVNLPGETYAHGAARRIASVAAALLPDRVILSTSSCTCTDE